MQQIMHGIESKSQRKAFKFNATLQRGTDAAYFDQLASAKL